MSAPVPDEIAAVIRAWRSLALIVSRVTSAPSALEASGICFRSISSPAGTKSTHRTRWSFVPWAWAGARPDSRIPARPDDTAAAAAPAAFMNDRRFIAPPMALLLVEVSGRPVGLGVDLLQLP